MFIFTARLLSILNTWQQSKCNFRYAVWRISFYAKIELSNFYKTRGVHNTGRNYVRRPITSICNLENIFGMVSYKCECVCVCVCEWVWVCESECVSVCVWVCVSECVSECECVWVWECECVCECVWVCEWGWVCVFARACASTEYQKNTVNLRILTTD
jgi:hypothetical protein